MLFELPLRPQGRSFEFSQRLGQREPYESAPLQQPIYQPDIRQPNTDETEKEVWSQEARLFATQAGGVGFQENRGRIADSGGSTGSSGPARSRTSDAVNLDSVAGSEMSRYDGSDWGLAE